MDDGSASGRKYVGVPALLIMGLGLSLLPFADGMTMLMIAGVLAGLGNGLSSGFVLTLGSDLAPLDDPGEFLGVWRFISDTGGAIGPPLIGGIAQVMALGTATWFTGGVAGLGALALVVSGKGDRGAKAAVEEAEVKCTDDIATALSNDSKPR